MMIRSLQWFIRALFFLIVLGFALANADIVQVQFIGFDTVWRAPLVVFLAGFFAAGMIVGLLALTPKLFSQRREIDKLKKTISKQASSESSAEQMSMVGSAGDRRLERVADTPVALPDRPHGV
ncbi:MAG: lipopolysaccharide assembly LapA domain-containing protein [Burkholderiales bacterium]|jgi:putative membrane protein